MEKQSFNYISSLTGHGARKAKAFKNLVSDGAESMIDNRAGEYALGRAKQQMKLDMPWYKKIMPIRKSEVPETMVSQYKKEFPATSEFETLYNKVNNADKAHQSEEAKKVFTRFATLGALGGGGYVGYRAISKQDPQVYNPSPENNV